MADLLFKKDAFSERVKAESRGSFLFYLSLILFFLAIAVYGGLTVLNRSQEKTKSDLSDIIQAKRNELRPELLDQIFLLDSRLKNIRSLLTKHIFGSNIFALLENDTDPQVRFKNFSFSVDTKRLDMSGEAASYAVLSRQIGIFERDPQIDQIDFGGLSLGSNNLLQFKITLTFKDSLLYLRP